ncbi:unnamed protein product [Diabrotica balteata]|uniref:Ig-like domain-containing protein n=1 Tax=Diabrotica balteata TaxID=107213 RepID=A0A9N9XGD7_DIABA|nr:unnamed protein product [Diabrotica balteata]
MGFSLLSTNISNSFDTTVVPRITPFYFEDNPVHSGQYVQVSCSVTEGDLPIKIDWELNNDMVHNIPEISITPVGKRTSSLEIEAVTYKHAGNYTCIATNTAGIATFRTELHVNGY